MTCQVIEDDVAFATVSGKALTVGAGIDGPTFGDGYWITLSAPPKDDVVVSLDCADTNVFYTKQLLFTPDDWDRKYVAVNASLADPNVFEGRTAELTHFVASADAFFDGLAVSDVEIAVEFSVDSVPPPKLELVRFLDGGNGLDVLFDSPTNMIDGEWDIDCATLFEYAAQQFGADGTCSWTNSSALRVTFGAGAQIVPFDYVAATTLNSAWLKGGVLKNDLDGATLTSAAQYAEAQKPLHPVAPAISITAPESVGVCDGVVLDARGATGGGSRALTYNWGVLTSWDAETDADMASVAALEAKLQQADAAGAVTLGLGFDDLLPGRAYDFLIAATNFLGVTTTAYATVDKLASPAPGVQFQGAATQTHGPVRQKVAQARRRAAQARLRRHERVVHGAGLRLARVAACGSDVHPRPRPGLGGVHRQPHVVSPAGGRPGRADDLQVPGDRRLRGHHDHQQLRYYHDCCRVAGPRRVHLRRRRAGRGDRRHDRAGRVRVVRPRRGGRARVRVDRGARAGRRE